MRERKKEAKQEAESCNGKEHGKTLSQKLQVREELCWHLR